MLVRGVSRILFVLLATLLVSCPAFAGGPLAEMGPLPAPEPKDAREIAACVAEKGDNLSSACIGIIADACLKHADSTERMRDCVTREVSVWDAWLNRDYRALRARLAPRSRQALQDIEMIFISEKGRKCSFGATLAGAQSTMQGPDVANCVLHETAEQWLWLRGFLQG